jgi:hypothetical protein
MAETLINEIGKSKYTAVSTSILPTGFVHPKSLETPINNNSFENPYSK